MLLPNDKFLTFDSCIISKASILNQEFKLVKQTNGSVELVKNSYLNFKFKFTLKDKLDEVEKKGYWFNNESVSKYLKFKVLVCFSEQENSLATRFVANGDYFPSQQIIEINLNEFKIKPNSFDPNTNETTFFVDKNFTVKAAKVEEIPFLSIKLVSYIDQQSIEKDFNIDFAFTSGVRGEFFKLQDAIKLIASSGINVNPTAYQIVDISSFEDIKPPIPPEKQESITQIANKQLGYFSDLFGTYFNFVLDKTAKDLVGVSYGFFFDHKRAIIENSIFPELAEKHPSLFQRNAKILRVNLKRFRTDYKSVYGDQEETLIAEKFEHNILSRIDQIDPNRRVQGTPIYVTRLNNNEDLLFFTGYDTEIAEKTGGTYKYKFEIELLDPAYEIVNNYKEKILESLKILENYKQVATIPDITSENIFSADPYINDINKQIVDQNTFIGTAKKGFYIPSENRFSEDLPTLGIEIAISNYLYIAQRVYENFIGMDLSAQFLSAIGPNTGNPENLEHFIKLNEELYQELDKKLIKKTAANAIIADAISEKSAQANPKFIQTIKFEKIFSYEVEAKKAGFLGFRYFNPSGNYGLNIMKSSQINNRTSQLLEKVDLFDGQKKYPIDVFNDFFTLSQINNLSNAFDSQKIEQIINLNFAILDLLLEIFDEQEFYDVLLEYTKLSSLVFFTSEGRVSLNNQSVDEAMASFINLVFSFFKKNSSLIVLQKNDTSLFLQAEIELLNLQNDFQQKVSELSNLIPSANQSQAEVRVEQILYLFGEFVYILKHVSAIYLAEGLLNNSQRTIDNKTSFEKKVDYYLSSPPPIEDLDRLFPNNGLKPATINKSGKLKLKLETMKPIKYVTFNKINEIINLSSPVFNDLDPTKLKTGETYLCFFENYVNNKALLRTSVYEKIPVFDKFFLLNYDEDPALKQPDTLRAIEPAEPPPATPVNPTDPTTLVAIGGTSDTGLTRFGGATTVTEQENPPVADITTPVYQPIPDFVSPLTPTIKTFADFKDFKKVGFVNFNNIRALNFEQTLANQDKLLNALINCNDESVGNEFGMFNDPRAFKLEDFFTQEEINKNYEQSDEKITIARFFSIRNSSNGILGINSIKSVDELGFIDSFTEVKKGEVLFNVYSLPAVVMVRELGEAKIRGTELFIRWDKIIQNSKLSIANTLIPNYQIKNNLFDKIIVTQPNFIENNNFVYVTATGYLAAYNCFSETEEFENLYNQAPYVKSWLEYPQIYAGDLAAKFYVTDQSTKDALLAANSNLELILGKVDDSLLDSNRAIGHSDGMVSSSPIDRLFVFGPPAPS